MHWILRTAVCACLAMPLFLGTLAGCQQPKKLSFDDARVRFASQGPQPGQPLPELKVTDVDGRPADMAKLQSGKPMVLVTASLTCTVAQHNQAAVDDLQRRFGDKVAVVVLYTIEAHPKGDVCPYTGEEWAMPQNEKIGIEHRQPTTQTQRLYLAKIYQTRFAPNTAIVVDTMDNAAWKAVGEAPNVALLVDSNGVIREREGWFDAEQMEKALAGLGVTPNIPPAPPKARS